MRSRATSSHRAAVLRRLSSSGLSLAAFCRREGLAYQTLLAWRRAQRLALAAAPVAAAPFLDVECAPDASSAGGSITNHASFAPTISATIPLVRQETLIAELALPGGVCLRVFSASTGANSETP
jgi:transposase-like protein